MIFMGDMNNCNQELDCILINEEQIGGWSSIHHRDYENP